MQQERKRLPLSQVKRRYEAVSPYLTERAVRIWAASEALVIGHGGAPIVSDATGISRVRIGAGKKELETGAAAEVKRVRRWGGGRKKLTTDDAQVLNDLDALIDPCTRGDPESPLRWTCKSTYQLAQALQAQGHVISQRSVYSLLKELGYSLQSNRKTEEGADHPIGMGNFSISIGESRAFKSEASR